jgi:hypothetical protein
MPIKVNDIEISDEAVFKEMQYHPGASNVEEAMFKSAQALVVQQLLLQESDADDADDEKAINALLANQVNIPDADEQSCKTYYQQNQAKFIDKETKKVLPFELVENHIKEYLQNQSTASGISDYIKMLIANARIKGFDFKDPSAMNVKIQ